MKKISTLWLLYSIAFLLQSCGNDSPQQCFNIAALNSNLLYTLAGNGFQRELASPSEKLVDEKTMVMAPMKRTEEVNNKIKSTEENYQKVKSLSAGDDAKQMLAASNALYELALPMLKNEYTQLAMLYDENSPADKIAAMEKNINDKYAVKFQTLYDALHKTSMDYASKHGLNVREVNPAPPSRKPVAKVCKGVDRITQDVLFADVDFSDHGNFYFLSFK